MIMLNHALISGSYIFELVGLKRILLRPSTQNTVRRRNMTRGLGTQMYQAFDHYLAFCSQIEKAGKVFKKTKKAKNKKLEQASGTICSCAP